MLPTVLSHGCEWWCPASRRRSCRAIWYYCTVAKSCVIGGILWNSDSVTSGIGSEINTRLKRAKVRSICDLHGVVHGHAVTPKRIESRLLFYFVRSYHRTSSTRITHKKISFKYYSLANYTHSHQTNLSKL